MLAATAYSWKAGQKGREQLCDEQSSEQSRHHLTQQAYPEGKSAGYAIDTRPGLEGQKEPDDYSQNFAQLPEWVVRGGGGPQTVSAGIKECARAAQDQAAAARSQSKRIGSSCLTTQSGSRASGPIPRKPSYSQKTFGQARIVQSIEPFNGRVSSTKQQSFGEAPASNYNDGSSVRSGARKIGTNLAAQRYGVPGDQRNLARS